MNFPGLIFLIIAHYFSGRGILRLFKLQLPPIQAVCFSFMLGVPLVSFAPCFVQLLHIPITFNSIFFSIAILTGVCSIPLLINFKRPQFKKIILPELYEWPFLLVCLCLVILSVWRAYYYPPTARDMLSGPELLAEYAVREKTMISSVFTLDLHTTNNYFKSPYITCLQIIYKLLVQPFGQVWESILYIPFVVFIYTMLRERVHPFLASLLLFFFMAIPDLFAYSFVMLYDYSNMVFFFGGFYFLVKHLENKQPNYFAFSVFLFGIATYIRVETVMLVAILALLPIYNFFKERLSLKTIALRFTAMIAVPAGFYVLCMYVFVRAFVPIHYTATNDINPHLGNIGNFFERINSMNDILIFGHQGTVVYGYFMRVFLVLFVADIIYFLSGTKERRFNREARFALFGIAVIYLGLPFLGYLFPLIDIMNTTKRGLFKLLPIMLLYMSNSGLVLRLSNWLNNLGSSNKEPKPKAKPAPVVAPKQTIKASSKKKGR